MHMARRQVEDRYIPPQPITIPEWKEQSRDTRKYSPTICKEETVMKPGLFPLDSAQRQN